MLNTSSKQNSLVPCSIAIRTTKKTDGNIGYKYMAIFLESAYGDNRNTARLIFFFLLPCYPMQSHGFLLAKY